MRITENRLRKIIREIIIESDYGEDWGEWGAHADALEKRSVPEKKRKGIKLRKSKKPVKKTGIPKKGLSGIKFDSVKKTGIKLKGHEERAVINNFCKEIGLSKDKFNIKVVGFDKSKSGKKYLEFMFNKIGIRKDGVLFVISPKGADSDKNTYENEQKIEQIKKLLDDNEYSKVSGKQI